MLFFYYFERQALKINCRKMANLSNVMSMMLPGERNNLVSFSNYIYIRLNHILLVANERFSDKIDDGRKVFKLFCVNFFCYFLSIIKGFSTLGSIRNIDLLFV